MTPQLTVGSLFAGIGGFDLAAEWMGWRTVWHSEIDPYACAVFATHFPHSRNVGDVTTWQPHPETDTVDVICGGFPCQDISTAGKGAGIDGPRSGLWREFARTIGILRPRYVVVENVAALLGRGATRVLGDLAALGYDAEWEVVSAHAVGAPHLRERVWIVAHTHRSGRGKQNLFRQQPWRAEIVSDGEAMAIAPSERLEGTESLGERHHLVAQSGDESLPLPDSHDSPTARFGEHGGKVSSWTESVRPDIRRGADWWTTEPNVGRVADGIPARVDRLRCLGNAIVPQAAYAWAFQRIAQLETERQ